MSRRSSAGAKPDRPSQFHQTFSSGVNNGDEVHKVNGLRELIVAADDLSNQVAFEAIAVKTLVLSAASYFEREISETILGAATECKVPMPLIEFIDRQGLKRKYHSLFSWEANNLNKFFSSFGKQAQNALSEKGQAGELEAAIAAFLYVNRARNNLVHENYAGATIDLTFDEAWGKYEAALHFVEWFSKELKEMCCGNEPAGDDPASAG